MAKDGQLIQKVKAADQSGKRTILRCDKVTLSHRILTVLLHHDFPSIDNVDSSLQLLLALSAQVINAFIF